MTDVKQDILDSEYKKPTKTYAQKSFEKFTWNIGILLFGIILLNGGIGIFILAIFFILAMIGFVQGIYSFKLKEKDFWKKYIGTFGNLLLLLLLVSFIWWSFLYY